MTLDFFGSAGDAYGLWFLRVVVAFIILVHAAPKLEHPRELAAHFAMRPATLVFLGILEILAAYALIFGYHLELAAALLIVIGLGSLLGKVIHRELPFSGASGHGWEFELLIVTACIAILLTGGGAIKLTY